jgi:hypothetical protein
MLSIVELEKLEQESKTKNLLTQNRKMKSTSNEIGLNVYNFSIPAYRSMKGKVICPMAGACSKFCYAQKGNYRYRHIQKIAEYKYQLTKHKDTFMTRMSNEIREKNVDVLRVHDAGDYYSLDYMKTWFNIAKANPHTVFYSYTKSHDMVRLAYRLGLVPSNYVFIFSTGSKRDDAINMETERHAVIFKTHEDLLNAGYVDASKNDLVAVMEKSNKIGLVYH